MPPAASATFRASSSGGTTAVETSGMADEERAPLHRRLHVLQSKLALLGYKDVVGTDSIELVEKLFDDLVATSESYERLQHREDLLSHDLALSQVRRPYMKGGRNTCMIAKRRYVST